MTPEEERELSLLILRRDFYNDRGVNVRIKKLEAKKEKSIEKRPDTTEKSDCEDIEKR